MASDVHANLLSQMVRDMDVYYSANLPTQCFPAGLLRDIYRVVRKHYDAGDDVDLTLLHADLPQYKASDLLSIVDAVPSSANWSYYAKAVREEWRKDRVRTLGLELQDRYQDDGVVEYAYTELSKLATSDDAQLHYAREMAKEFVEVVEERYQNKGRLPGVATGFAELDGMLLGLKPRLLYYVGARPSKGKTALITSMIANICAEGVPVGLLSLESSRKEIMARLFANIGSIDNQILVTGAFERLADFGRVGDAAEEVYGWPLVICDKENMDLQTIRAKAREMVRTGKAKVLFLDYIQLVPQANYQLPYRLHMNEVSMAFKQLARELEVPFVVAAQLGRNAQDKEPTLADFKETGQIEQDADGAILIHEDGEATRLIVAKNKDGPRGSVKVEFHKPYMRFVDPFTREVV